MTVETTLVERVTVTEHVPERGRGWVCRLSIAVVPTNETTRLVLMEDKRPLPAGRYAL